MIKHKQIHILYVYDLIYLEIIPVHIKRYGFHLMNPNRICAQFHLGYFGYPPPVMIEETI